jgi:uncharacterized protein (DUF2237 family)
MTGFYRDGCCNTGGADVGVHVVCALMTDEFLAFSARMGNDLSTPQPMYGFDGLKAGDQWCLCASRWKEALDNDMAPPVYLAGTHMAALEYATLDELTAHAIDGAITIDGDTAIDGDAEPDSDSDSEPDSDSDTTTDPGPGSDSAE